MNRLAMDPNFLHWLGAFHCAWNSVELLTSYAIGKILNIPPHEANVLTAGMEAGRKLTLLRNLVYKSDIKNKKEIQTALNHLQNSSKRNIFAHSYVISNQTKVTFIDRSRGGDYSAVKHEFTAESFFTHVKDMMRVGMELHTALGATAAELDAFAMAALNDPKRSTTSPQPQSHKA